MNNDITKDKIQAEILPLVRKENRAMVVAATGVGKSKVAIDYAKELVLQIEGNHDRNAKILIIVPTEKLRDENWLEEFDRWDARDVWEINVTRSCYVSANKLFDGHYDLVIMDEAHNVTENNSLFFSQNHVEKVIALTATAPKDDEKKAILKDLGFKIVYELPLDIAVKLGLVSPYEITVVEVRLDDKEKYLKSGTKDKPFFQTERKKYDYLSLIIKRLMFSNSSQAKKTLKFKLLERMRLIYNLKSKTKVAEFLLEDVIPKSERTLIFCGSINQAEHLNKHSFHSKKTNSKDFDNFKTEKINRLSCVNALNEGHNIPNVDNALIVQLNSKELNLVQRVGRIVRYRKGHIAQIYIICAVDSQDEKWVQKALDSFDKRNIKYQRYENLVSRSLTLKEA